MRRDLATYDWSYGVLPLRQKRSFYFELRQHRPLSALTSFKRRVDKSTRIINHTRNSASCKCPLPPAIPGSPLPEPIPRQYLIGKAGETLPPTIFKRTTSVSILDRYCAGGVSPPSKEPPFPRFLVFASYWRASREGRLRGGGGNGGKSSSWGRKKFERFRFRASEVSRLERRSSPRD